MAIPYIRSIGAAAEGDGSTLSIPAPASYSDGDLFVIVVSNYGGAALSTPEGWTLVRQRSYAAVYTKVASGAQANVSIDVAASGCAFMIAVANTDGTTQTHADAYHAAGSSTITSPAYTTTADNELVLHCIGIRDDNTVSDPVYGNLKSGTTGYNYAATALGADSAAIIQYGLMESAGSIGTVEITQSSTDANVCITLGVNPSAASTSYLPGVMRHHIIAPKGVILHG